MYGMPFLEKSMIATSAIPYERHQQLSARGKLDYLEVMDYCKIILANFYLLLIER